MLREDIFRCEFFAQTINLCLRKWWEGAGASCPEQTLTQQCHDAQSMHPPRQGPAGQGKHTVVSRCDQRQV